MSSTTSDAAKRLTEIALIDSFTPSRKKEIHDLLERHPHLDSYDLGLACMLGNVDFVRATVELNPEEGNKATGIAERPPLLYAVFSWFLKNDDARKPRIRETVRLLLEKGANPNAAYLHDNAPLSALFGAAGVVNDAETVKLLLNKGANVNDGESLYHSVEHKGIAVLELLFTRHLSEDSKSHAIFRKLDFDDLDTVRWLLHHGIDPNQRWKPDGSTPLIHALRRGRSLPFFELLLQKGSDPSLANDFGTRPFPLAKSLGRNDVANLLLSNGASPDLGEFEAWVAGVLSRTPTTLALPDFKKLTRDQAEVLCSFASDGDIAATTALLDAGVPIDLGPQSTPLHTACWNGKLGMVRVLLQRGAPVEPKDALYNSTPTGWTQHGSVHCRGAAPEDYVAIYEALVSAGAALPSTEEPWWQEEGSASPEVQAWLRAQLQSEKRTNGVWNSGPKP